MKPSVYVDEPKDVVLTDWNGHVLDAEALNYVGVGNVVRIVIKDDTIGWVEAVYVEIREEHGDGSVTGIVLDTYRHSTPWLEEPIEDGELLRFSRRCITEIPFHKKENQNIRDVAEKKTVGRRSITGVPEETGDR